MSTKRDLYQEVTDRMIALIEAGTLPWRKDWSVEGGVYGAGLPVNLTGRAYNGINVCLLWATAMERDYKSNTWATYKQVAERGGQVRKGEKSTLVVFFKTLEVDDKDSDGGETKKIPLIRGFHVFNLDQCDGIQPVTEEGKPEVEQVWQRDARLDEFAKNCAVELKFNTGRAYYSPLHDYVGMPEPRLFKSSGGFYATLLHELVHWTGHKSRLNRLFATRFGSDAYAVEELVAELGSAFLCAELGVPSEVENHANYLGHWLKVLKADKRAMFTASSAASKAANFLKALQVKLDSGEATHVNESEHVEGLA
jgi:antirestriction protein ArdC